MQLRIGVCAAATISNDIVTSLNNFSDDQIKVLAIATTNIERSKKFATKYNIERAYGNYQELANDKDINVVYICTRNHQNYAAGKLFIEAGKHVIIEKPFTIDVDTTKELFELAKKKGVFAMEALWSRWVPAYQKIREIIKSGQIGELLHVQANFVMSCNSERVLMRKYGGGVCLDIGVYGLHSLFEGVGYKAPKDVKAHARFHDLDPENSSDVTVSAILDFPGPTTATLLLTAQANKEHFLAMNHVLYAGSKGYIKIEGDYINNPESMEVNGKIVSTSTDDGQKTYLWSNSHGLRFEFEEVRKCLMQGKLNSDIHGPEQTTLLIDTLHKLMDEIGYDVIGCTDRTNTFKHT